MKSNSVCFSTVARSLTGNHDGDHWWGIINAFYLFIPFKHDLTRCHLSNRKIPCNFKRSPFKRLNLSLPFSSLHFDLRCHITGQVQWIWFTEMWFTFGGSLRLLPMNALIRMYDFLFPLFPAPRPLLHPHAAESKSNPIIKTKDKCYS